MLDNDWVKHLVWMESADGDDRGFKVLDCTYLAREATAMTDDPKVAERFLQLREDDGSSLVGVLPTHSVRYGCDLAFAHGGSPPEDGMLFMAQTMEQKWDIACYDHKMYFRRSWNGTLVHVVELEVTEDQVFLHTIHSNRKAIYGNVDYGEAQVKFIAMTHLAKDEVPYPLPPGFDKEDLARIAMFGFNLYGEMARYALVEDPDRGY